MMVAMALPLPIVPLESATLYRPLAPSLARAIAALVLGRAQRQSPHEVLRAKWPDDRPARMIVEAVTSPDASASLPFIADLAASLAPRSAASRLIRAAGLCLRLPAEAVFTIPGIGIQALVMAKPVSLGPLQPVILRATLPKEMSDADPVNVAALLGALLTESAGTALDAALIGGLLKGGVSRLASAIGDFASDVVSIATAMAGGDVNPTGLTLIAAPRPAIKFNLARVSKTFECIPTSALSAGCVMGVEPRLLAVAFGDTIEADIAEGADMLVVQLRLGFAHALLRQSACQCVADVKW
jgi:hypothetical protein